MSAAFTALGITDPVLLAWGSNLLPLPSYKQDNRFQQSTTRFSSTLIEGRSSPRSSTRFIYLHPRHLHSEHFKHSMNNVGLDTCHWATRDTNTIRAWTRWKTRGRASASKSRRSRYPRCPTSGNPRIFNTSTMCPESASACLTVHMLYLTRFFRVTLCTETYDNVLIKHARGDGVMNETAWKEIQQRLRQPSPYIPGFYERFLSDASRSRDD